MKKNIKKCFAALLAVIAVISFTGCQPDEAGNGNGLSDTNVDASFTITPVAGSANRFILKSDGSNVITNKWNIGKGVFKGSDNQEVFLADAGNYTISHTAIGRGGVSNTLSQQLAVSTSDPAAGNMVKGGNFLNAEDQAQWTILHISGTATNWTFNEGSATVKGGSNAQQGIYQALQVEANKKYTLDMKVKGSGATDTWFEVYVSPVAPTQNSDYSAGGKRLSLNTWAGCGNNSFDDYLSSIGCDGSGPIVEFPTSGTVYLVIKSGGGNLGTTGISISEVEFRGSSN